MKRLDWDTEPFIKATKPYLPLALELGENNIKPFKEWQFKISEENFREARKNYRRMEKSNFVDFRDYRAEHSFVDEMNEKVWAIVRERYPTAKRRGTFYYPPQGYMKWHTNQICPGTRVYVTWAREAGKSFLRYRKNKQFYTDYDDAGFSFRTFYIPDSTEEPFWHCVGSETQRLSWGFLIDEKI